MTPEVEEAFAAAVERWPRDGVPRTPGAWLTTTATRKALDRVRRESHRDGKHEEARRLFDDDEPARRGAVDDDRLRLVFTCCHPALSPDARVALTLRMVGGLTVPQIARAFLVQETTMGQRISRAKAKIKAAGIPYRVPTSEDVPARLDGVLTVLFLVFNEGYLASGPPSPGPDGRAPTLSPGRPRPDGASKGVARAVPSAPDARLALT